MARVLVIDDQADIRRMLRDVLTELGHTVLEAADPHDAMIVAACEQPDVALCDYDLGARMHGVALLGRVRELAPHTFRVLLSGGVVPGLDEHERRGTVQHFVAKPWSLAELRRALGEPVRTTRGRVALATL